jgi:hypothetical protein
MPDLPRALPALANEARVALDGPRPSPELMPPLPAERHVVLTGRAISVPFRARHHWFATVNHGHSRPLDLGTLYYRCAAARMVRMGSPVRFRRGAPHRL